MLPPEDRFNPFPGLRSFEPDEDHLFFGREDQIDEILGRLRRTRFLSVVGTSGSGKSSVVRSGLIPSLYSGFMAQAGSSWRIAIMRPGEDPIGYLAAALNDPEVLGSDDEELAEMNRSLLETTLLRSAMGLAECVRQARMPANDNLLLLVDQFEELFRFKRDLRIKDSRDAAVAFVKLLLEASRQEDVKIYVVLTMRSDFIGNCTELPGLAEAINQGQYLVPRMTREERRAAIAGPVAVGGAEIAPRLVLRMLNDVGDAPDQLPILQHALRRSWDYWEEHHADSEPIDLRHYEAIGTLKEALSQHAEEAYRELGTSRRREIAEALMKALTDRGSDSRGVRRPIRLREACELTSAGEQEVVAVVECFRAAGRNFLMPPPDVSLSADSILDISHESLMRNWERLIRWVDEEAASAQQYLRLSKAAAQYQEGKAALYRDPELQLAVNWQEQEQPTAVWAQRYDPAFERAILFLEHSQKQHELEIAEKERRRQRRLERARRMLAVAGTAAFLFLALGIHSMILKLESDGLRDQAQTNLRAAETAKEKAEQAKEDAEAARDAATREKAEADLQRRKAEDQQKIADSERGRAQQQEQRALDEKQRAEGSQAKAEASEREAKLQTDRAVAERRRADDEAERAHRQEAEASRLARLSLARTLAVQAARMGTDQQELAALLALESYQLHRDNRARSGQPSDARSEDPEVYTALRNAVQNLDSDHVELIRGAHGGAVRAIALGPQGHLVASGGDDGAVKLFDLRRPQDRPRVLAEAPQGAPAAGREVRAVAFDGLAGTVAAAGRDGSIRLWSLAGGGGPRNLTGHGAAVTALAFPSDGGPLASGDVQGNVRLWDPERGESIRTLGDGSAGPVTGLALPPDGAALAVARGAAGVELWSLEPPGSEGTSGTPRQLANGHDVRSLAWNGDSRLLAGGTHEGTILVWDLSRPRHGPEELAAHESTVTGLSFSLVWDLLASAGLDGAVMLWDLRRRQDAEQREPEPIVLRDHSSWVWAVALSPDGEHAVSGGSDRTLRFRVTRSQRLAEKICGLVTRNLSCEEWRSYMPTELPYEATCAQLPSEGECDG